MPTRYYLDQKVRYAIYDRDDRQCFYCEESCIYHETAPNRFTVDHIILLVNGGNSKPTNLITSCAKCNVERGTTDIDTWLIEKGKTRQALDKKLNTPLCTSLLDKLKKMSIPAARQFVLSI